MRALKELDKTDGSARNLNVTGNWNPAFADEMVEGDKPTLSDIVNIVTRLSRDAAFLRLASSDPNTSHAIKTIVALSKEPTFQKSLIFANKVRPFLYKLGLALTKLLFTVNFW
jgi:hypothetical protein